MIRETEVKEILEKNVPEMKLEASELKSLYKTIDSFAAFTKEVMKQGNLPIIGNCFATAELLIDEGTENIKLAIENIYVFSVTAFMDVTGAVSKQVKELLPDHMRAEYDKQVSSACS